MGTRFTRVTVVGDQRQIDVSLPADAPLAEQLPMVLRLLSVPSSPVPVRWVLSTPELGPLARDRSLDEVGILDGMVLYLTEGAAAAPPPFVDDVESAAADTVAEVAPAWDAAPRRSGVAGLLALVLLAAQWVALGASSPVTWIGAALSGLLALVIGALVAERGGLWVALTAVPAAAIVVVTAVSDGLTAADLLLAVAAAAFALLVVGLVRRAPGLVTGGAVAAVIALVGWVCLTAGLPADRAAGLVLLVTVIAAGLAGQFALGGAGLVNLLVADERGQKVPRTAVVSSVLRGQSIATGVVWAAAGGAAVACWALLSAGGPGTGNWIAPAMGGLGGLLFLLRSRMFTRARQVVPMLGVGSGRGRRGGAERTAVAAGGPRRGRRHLAGAARPGGRGARGGRFR